MPHLEILLKRNICWKVQKIYIHPHHYTIAFILVMNTFSPILLSCSDSKINPEIPYLLLFSLVYLLKWKTTFRSMRYKSFIGDKMWQDEKELLQKFPKENLER